MKRESFGRLAAVAILTLGIGMVGCQTTQETPSSTPDTAEWDDGPAETTTRSTTPLTDLQTVYFDFDRSDIRADARDALRANAERIKSASGTVTVQGHCDERGSEEFNRALGERRALAVEGYLSNLGVASSQLQTVSFGEDRPAVSGHDESAWRYNRRADFVGE